MLAVLGLLMSFIPGVNLFAGVLLLPAFVIAIVALVKKMGGKGMSIAALIISVVGWIVSIVMVILYFIGLAAVSYLENPNNWNDSSSSEEDDSWVDETPADEGDAAEEAVPGAYDEAAFIRVAKPEVVRILTAEIPNATPELVAAMFPDSVLLALGQAIVAQDKIAGGLMDAGAEEEFRTAFVESMASSGGISLEAAGAFFDVVAENARAYLVE